MQVVGLGTQDDFPFATRFKQQGGLQTPTLLWDPSFATWQVLGVTANSQMMLLSPDLSGGSNLIYGFNEEQRSALLDVIGEL